MNQDSTVAEVGLLLTEINELLASDAALLQEFSRRNPTIVRELRGFLQTEQLKNEGNKKEGNGDQQRQLFDDDSASDETFAENLPATKSYALDNAHEVVEPTLLGWFGGYELLEVIAQGGMGVVYKARQQSLDRPVAIKMIRSGRLTTVSEVQRFRQEALAAAVLRHPSIVPIIEYGSVEGQHFFSMEYIDGPSLAELIRQGPLNPTTAAEYVSTIARTIQYAHNQGIIHRDLKPSNVLVDRQNQLYITDFGVAKSVDDDGALSKPGQFVGTPSYMSPEQSRATIGAVSPRADIYSLGGAVLYALLTGRPPFQAASEADTLIQVRTQDPVAPRSLNPDIPRDLETICLKCLRKDPDRRYATADELADDLDRFLEDKPIVARPVSWMERLARVCKRNPAVAALSTAFTAGSIIFIVLLANANTKLSLSILDLDRSIGTTRAALEKAAQHAYVSDIKEAVTAWLVGDVRSMDEFLARHNTPMGTRDYRGGEWDFLQNFADSACETVFEGEQPFYCLCFSPDGHQLAVSGKDAVIHVLDSTTSKPIVSFPSEQLEVNWLVFSPDGKSLVSGGDDGTVRVWKINSSNPATREQLRIDAHPNQVYCVAYALNESTLISSGRDTKIRMWDPATGQLQGELEANDSSVEHMSVSPNGEQLASARGDTVFLWDLKTKTQTGSINPQSGRLTSVSYSPGGDLLSTSSIGRKVQMWNVATGKLDREFNHFDQFQMSLFTPDGRYIVACDFSGTIHIWNLAEKGDAKPFLPGMSDSAARKAHRDRVFALAVSPDGRRLLSVGGDGKVLARNFIDKPQNIELKKEGVDFIEMAFLSDRNLLATVDEHSVEFWQPDTGALVDQVFTTDETLRCLAVSANGRVLAAGSLEGHVHVCQVPSGTMIATLETRPEFQTDQIAVSSDGALVAAVERFSSGDDDLYVLNVATGKRLTGIVCENCNSAAFSPDGRWLFSSGPSNVVSVWDLKSQKQVKTQFGHVSSINRIAFSLDGTCVATCSDDRLVKLWDTRDWKNSHTFAGHLAAVRSVAFAPDRRTLVSGDEKGLVKFWNVPTGLELFELANVPNTPRQLTFSPDGKYLAFQYADPSRDPSHEVISVFNWRHVTPE